MSVEEELLEQARSRLGDAYAPHSKFHVGAAVRAASGIIYTGVNIENDNYTNTRHAEGVAVMKAVDAGERELTHVAVAVQDGRADSPAARESPEPCGTCKQTLTQFMDGPITLILDDGEGDSVTKTLPEEFTL